MQHPGSGSAPLWGLCCPPWTLQTTTSTTSLLRRSPCWRSATPAATKRRLIGPAFRPASPSRRCGCDCGARHADRMRPRCASSIPGPAGFDAVRRPRSCHRPASTRDGLPPVRGLTRSAGCPQRMTVGPWPVRRPPGSGRTTPTVAWARLGRGSAAPVLPLAASSPVEPLGHEHRDPPLDHAAGRGCLLCRRGATRRSHVARPPGGGGAPRWPGSG